MRIDEVMIACYRGDFWQTKIAVSSIRHWHPDVRISLIKDRLRGDFDTSRLEKDMGVEVLELPMQRFGWGVSKLEAMMLPGARRVLIMDSDIVFVGPVLSDLEQSDSDFVVSADPPADPHSEWFRRTYYRIDGVRRQVDAGFSYPGFSFNTGHIVCTTGLLKRTDFEGLIEFSEPPRLLRSDVLSNADQGVLNYLLPKLALTRGLTIDRRAFALWSLSPEADSVSLGEIREHTGQPRLIHWAGEHSGGAWLVRRADILRYFQSEYYRRQPRGWLMGACASAVGFATALRTTFRKSARTSWLRAKSKLVPLKRALRGAPSPSARGGGPT